MRTDCLRDLIKKVYIYPHALFSGKDIASGSLEKPLQIPWGRVSVAGPREWGVRVSCSVCWGGYAHIRTFSPFSHLRAYLRTQAAGSSITKAFFKTGTIFLRNQ